MKREHNPQKTKENWLKWHPWLGDLIGTKLEEDDYNGWYSLWVLPDSMGWRIAEDQRGFPYCDADMAKWLLDNTDLRASDILEIFDPDHESLYYSDDEDAKKAGNLHRDLQTIMPFDKEVN